MAHSHAFNVGTTPTFNIRPYLHVDTSIISGLKPNFGIVRAYPKTLRY